MRGKVQTAFTFLIDTGITPAYAGKRTTQTYFGINYEDHPRLCGEKYAMLYAVPSTVGITPAYAGKSYGYYTIEVSF